jgi:hypothetical protein
MTDLDKKELFEKIKKYREEQRKRDEYNSMMAKFRGRMNLA